MDRQVLIIGYGNTLRRDDRVGPRIARRVPQWRRPGVTTRDVFQLTPELAADLAGCTHALFVDAACGVEDIELRAVEPRAESGSLGHASSPARVLGWAAALYGHSPAAWLLTVPAF